MTDSLGLSLSLDQTNDWRNVISTAKQAEAQGYTSFWIPEAWGRDAFTMLAVLARETTSINVATGIVNIFSRTPALIAQSIASLDDLSNGRAILGLGASGPTVVERWHGVKFEKVIQRSREYVEIIRAILSGGRVDHNGEIFQPHGFSLGFKPVRTSVPIFLAAMGPDNVRLAGEIADGWLPIFACRAFIDEARPWLAEGAAIGSRSQGPTVAAYIPAVTGDRGADLLRRHLAFYIGGMGTFYHQLMVRSGFATEAHGIRDAWLAGSRADAASKVTESMLEATCIFGSASSMRRQLADFRALGIELPIVTIPRGASPEEAQATVKALGNGS